MSFNRFNVTTAKKVKKFIKDISGIIFGSAIAGFGLALFLIPFKASPGGAAGVAQIFYYIFNFKPGISMLVINIPLFIIGLIIFGKLFGLKTIIGMFFLSIFTDYFSTNSFLKISGLSEYLYNINSQAVSLTDNTLLGVLAGSLLLGGGIGFVVKFNGSTGGSDIPALLIRKYFGLSLGTSFLIIDTIIIFIVGITFKNANLILWGFLSLYITTKATDYVMEGMSYTKGVFIISDKMEEIRQYILNTLSRGCTILSGRGGYTDKEKNIIYIAIHQRELPRLKQAVKEIDKKAFMVVNDAHETQGEGFNEWEDV